MVIRADAALLPCLIEMGRSEVLHNRKLPDRAGAASSRRWQQSDRPILAYGLMLVAAVSLVLNYFIKFPTLPDEAAARFRAFHDKRLSLQIETSDALKLERFFAAEGISCPVRVLDPTTHTLRGGRIERLLNRKTCWYVYQGPGNKLFVFQMYPGSVRELPAGEILDKGGLRFHLYRRQDSTAVFWQEEGFCHLLISDAAPNEVIRLAQSSARS